MVGPARIPVFIAYLGGFRPGRRRAGPGDWLDRGRGDFGGEDFHLVVGGWRRLPRVRFEDEVEVCREHERPALVQGGEGEGEEVWSGLSWVAIVERGMRRKIFVLEGSQPYQGRPDRHASCFLLPGLSSARGR